MPKIDIITKAKFVELLTQGLSIAEAGRQAGISLSAAYRWAHDEDTVRELQKIKFHSRHKAYMDWSRKLERLSEIASSQLKEPVTGREAVMAIAELNKMEGDYAPEKHWERREVIVRVVYEDEPKKLEEPQDIGVEE